MRSHASLTKIAASLMLAAAMSWPALPHAQEAETEAPPAAPALVKITRADASHNQYERQFFGRVAARKTVDLAFQVSGQINELPVIAGQPIEKGGVIAMLDLEPFELQLQQAKLQKDQADRTVARLVRLRGKAASQVSIDDARTQAGLAGVALSNAERSLRNATLHAPFDGLVAARNVENFTTIRAGTPIVRLHDMSEIRIDIDVPEILFQQAAGNDDFRIEAKFVASDTRFPLEVREFNAETAQIGQTYRLSFGMAPPPDLSILPGSSVTVYATRTLPETGIAVPASALRLDNDGSAMVMVFTPDAEDPDLGQIHLQQVQITATDTGDTLIMGGLEPGSEIVASGVARLADGQKVRRFTGFAN